MTSAFLASRRWGYQMSRLVSHPEPEQLLLRVLGTTLVVAGLAGLAELVGASAAVGAFLVGLTLTGAIANRAGAVLAPLCCGSGFAHDPLAGATTTSST